MYLDNWNCTCGFETASEKEAVVHVQRWHLRMQDMFSWQAFKDRVLVMIYNQSGGLHIVD